VTQFIKHSQTLPP